MSSSIINHHEEDWRLGHYDSFVESRECTKLEFQSFSDVKNDDFGKKWSPYSLNIKCRLQYTVVYNCIVHVLSIRILSLIRSIATGDLFTSSRARLFQYDDHLGRSKRVSNADIPQ